MSMSKILVLAAALGLGLSSASACEFQRSAKVDKTVVASITTSEKQSTPVTVPVPVEQPETAPADLAE
jgi:hypothetical protein